jgi:hypothetical protein
VTAKQARTDPSVRDQISRDAHAGDRAVKSYLDGYPPGHGRLAASLRAVAAAAGIDLATIPVRSEAEIAHHRADRRPRCKRCAELEARVAELESQLGVSGSVVTANASQVPGQATDRPPKPTLVASAG